ncbi:GIY-YIG nuclease superfamily [uncultured Caudovirales phage]|uniref:GIY-YIG nuclease superfamily n=1 Tax=uncultured Caudovirales phage TaxID=2100421 RepID=A0A6J5MTQ7_9CAUD|nr:GIY-YIG nuclease superfamily [uncultured Caudovirales phage]
MKLEYIVKCQYYGVSKTYNKVFYSDKEYLAFKNWINTKRGYTNIKFLKKSSSDNNTKELVELDIKLSNKTKKDSLKSYLLNNKKEVLFYKFIYCLIEDNEIVYVGKTINIQSRIVTHKKGELKNFDSFSIIAKLPNEISDSELLKLEEKYIKLLKPKYNIIHNI